jgi:hypothetical protein
MTDNSDSKRKSGASRDRRGAQRFPLRGEAWFQWQSPSGQWCQGLGLTRNVGREGAFVETEILPPMVSQLRVVVTLVGRPDKEMQVRLCGAGQVRHVRREEGVASGFGAWVHFRTEAVE